MTDPNLTWLFGAYGIGYLLIFMYLFLISRRELSVRRRLDALRELLGRKTERS